MASELAGQRIWVTRPANQSARLIGLLAAAGAAPLALPLLEIAPPLDPIPSQAVLAGLTQFDLAIFVSPTALEMTLAALDAPWPESLPIAVIGPGSLRLARQLGFRHIVAPPSQFDSEGLLALAELQQVQGRRILILRGDGGRDVLPAGLSARGAEVTQLSVYRRLPPRLDASQLAIELALGCDGLIISSSEAAQHLFALAGADLRSQLQSRLFFAPHPRIAATLQDLGVQRTIETATGDDGILAAIQAHFCNN